MSTDSHSDILIVGAGMVGAALSLALARAGWQVTVLDRAAPSLDDDAAQPDLRVSAISAGSERWLRRLGVWGPMEQRRVAPYRRLSVWEQPTDLEQQLPFLQQLTEQARTTFDAGTLGRSHLGHIVENSVTQAALWEVLEEQDNVHLAVPATVKKLRQTDTTVTVTLDNDETLTASLVVGADGAQSVTRSLAGIGTSRDQYEQQAMVITVAHEHPPQDITWQMFTPSGPRAYLPLPTLADQCWGSLVWYDHPATLDRLGALDEAELLMAIQDAFPSELPPLQAAPARGRFPIARQHAHQYYKGRVVLVGDAAHTINPLAGQGLNLGFQDAAALSERLLATRRAQGDAGDPRVLADYERERRPENALMMRAMDLFYHGFSNNRAPLRLMRNAGLALAGNLPFARDEVARYAMGLDSRLSPAVKRVLNALPPLPTAI